MKWSWRIGRVSGIGIYVHATFLVLVAGVGLLHYLPNHSLAESLGGLMFIGALFGIIVLHELGHAFAARRFGIRTEDITLLPIGGVARLQRMPEDPKQELLIALAGPAVNVVLAAVFAASLVAVGALGGPGDLAPLGGTLLGQLMFVNVALAVFNLLPAFPMDGGRVLRALLAMRMDYLRATQIAAGTGKAMALLFGLLGLLANPFLIFIALFVWVGAARESGLVQMQSALGQMPTGHAAVGRLSPLLVADELRESDDWMLPAVGRFCPLAVGPTGVGCRGVSLTRHYSAYSFCGRGDDSQFNSFKECQNGNQDDRTTQIEEMRRLRG